MKVFKIPDGNGNIIFKVQTPDGQWHETDEQGNFSLEFNGGYDDTLVFHYADGVKKYKSNEIIGVCPRGSIYKISIYN